MDIHDIVIDMDDIDLYAEWGQALLAARMQVIHVRHEEFKPGYRCHREVIPSHRLILVLRGALMYRVEAAEERFGRGQLLMVPAWVQREWTVAPGGKYEATWVNFATPDLLMPEAPFLHGRVKRLSLEKAAFARMFQHWNEALVRSPVLLEGEIKAVLGRFFAEQQQPFTKPPTPLGVAQREVEHVRRWLERNYEQPDALTTVIEKLRLSRGYFQRLFRRSTGKTPGAYLDMLRLRAARYLLAETELSIKEIAVRVGIPDALYFSRRYRSFWGHPPSIDR